MKATALLNYTTASSTNINTKRLPNVNPLYIPTYTQEASAQSANKIRSAVTALNNLTTNTFNSVGVEIEFDLTGD